MSRISKTHDDLLAKFSSVPKLKTLLFAEFDSAIGPVLTYQIPEKLFEKQRFDTFSAAVITKSDLFNHLIKINLTDYKIMGYPVGLSEYNCLIFVPVLVNCLMLIVFDHSKYQRHAYIFNLCFVVENESQVDCVYEPLVQKCAQYLVQLECECQFLFDQESKKNLLPALLQNIFDGLNGDGQCIISVTEQTTLHLKLSPSFQGKEPPKVSPHMVPMFIRLPPPVSPADLPKLDVLSQKICPFIDGLRSVQEIAGLVQIDSDLVGRCIRNLQFCGCVTLVPLFLYSNCYVSTETLHRFYHDCDAIKDCIEFVRLCGRGKEATGQQPTVVRFSDIFRLYASLRPGMALKEWCRRMDPRSMNIDERRLIQFGMVRGFLRKLSVYPVYVGGDADDKRRIVFDCDGRRSLEELALVYSILPQELYQRLSGDERFVFITK